MGKFSPGELKKSLIDNITLMESEYESENNHSIWATFDEIEFYLNQGFKIFNEEKREYYEKIKRNK